MSKKRRVAISAKSANGSNVSGKMTLGNVTNSVELRARLTQTDELLNSIQKSINTDYRKQKEAYKNQKKQLMTV